MPGLSDAAGGAASTGPLARSAAFSNPSTAGLGMRGSGRGVILLKPYSSRWRRTRSSPPTTTRRGCSDSTRNCERGGFVRSRSTGPIPCFRPRTARDDVVRPRVCGRTSARTVRARGRGGRRGFAVPQSVPRHGERRTVGMSISGHKTISMFRRYDILSRADQPTPRKRLAWRRRDCGRSRERSVLMGTPVTGTRTKDGQNSLSASRPSPNARFCSGFCPQGGATFRFTVEVWLTIFAAP